MSHRTLKRGDEENGGASVAGGGEAVDGCGGQALAEKGGSGVAGGDSGHDGGAERGTDLLGGADLTMRRWHRPGLATRVAVFIVGPAMRPMPRPMSSRGGGADRCMSRAGSSWSW